MYKLKLQKIEKYSVRKDLKQLHLWNRFIRYRRSRSLYTRNNENNFPLFCYKKGYFNHPNDCTCLAVDNKKEHICSLFRVVLQLDQSWFPVCDLLLNCTRKKKESLLLYFAFYKSDICIGPASFMGYCRRKACFASAFHKKVVLLITSVKNLKKNGNLTGLKYLMPFALSLGTAISFLHVVGLHDPPRKTS